MELRLAVKHVKAHEDVRRMSVELFLAQSSARECQGGLISALRYTRQVFFFFNKK